MPTAGRGNTNPPPSPEDKPFEITYQQYLESVAPEIGQDYGSEAGGQFQPITEDAWNRMSNRERYANLALGRQGVQNHAGVDFTDLYKPSDELIAIFRQRFGDEPWKDDQSGIPGARGQLFYGYVDERTGTPVIQSGNRLDGPDQFAIDPSRIIYLPDGRFVMERSNIDGKWLAQAQATDDRMSNQHMTRGAIHVATLAAGSYLYNGGFGPAVAGADTLAAAPGQGFGTAAPGSAGAVTPGSVAATTTAPGTGTQAPAPVTDATPPPPGGPGTQPGAPVSEIPPAGTQPGGNVPVTSAGNPPAPTPGNGIIDSVVRTARAPLDYYNSLSRGSQFILGTAVSTGVSSALGSRAQQAATQQANEREQREREDRRRRSQVQPFNPNAFTPRGIIGSRGG